MNKLIFALPLYLAACAPDDTHVLVVLGSDYGDRISAIRVRVFDDRGDPQADQRFELAARPLPFSFAVRPVSLDHSFMLRAEAVDPDDRTLSTRTVWLDPNPDRNYVAYLFLPAACQDITCPERQSCGEAGCGPDYLTDDQKKELNPGEELAQLCQPGAAACTPALDGVALCERFGEAPRVSYCAQGQQCGGDPATCQNSTHSAQTYNLQLRVIGDGEGQITAQGPQLTCRDSCTFPIPKGQELSLNAVPDREHYFVAWDGACWTNQMSCVFEVYGDMTVTARFEPNGVTVEHEVTVNYVGSGSGRIRSDDGKLDCSGSCRVSYPHQSNVTVRAEAAQGSVFAGWEGACSSITEPVCTFLVQNPVELKPRFEPRPTQAARFDLNGDGFSDLIYAAPGMPSQTWSNAGRIYVRLGPIPAEYWIASDRVRHVWDGPEVGAELGRAFSAASDLDGDGVTDLVVGAPGVSNKTGAVYGVMGGPNLPVNGRLDNHPQALMGQRPGEMFGAALTTRPDLDGDGHADLIVGAPGGPNQKGRVYIYLSSSFQNQTSAPQPAAILEGEQDGDQFGWLVQSVGDLNRDGRDEFLVGAPRYNLAQRQKVGRAYLFNFSTNLSLTQALTVITGTQPNHMLGFSGTGLGDWQGDVNLEWALSTHVNDTVYVFSGVPALPLTELSTARWVLQGTGFFGAALAGFEDYTGDGRPDLVVGAPMDGGPARGSVKLFAGGGPVQGPAFQINSAAVDQNYCSEEGLGYSVGPAGDLNADGTLELAIGARFGGGPAGPEEVGRILIHSFNGRQLPPVLTSAQAPWEIVGEPVAHGLCASLSDSRAFWITAAQPL